MSENLPVKHVASPMMSIEGIKYRGKTLSYKLKPFGRFVYNALKHCLTLLGKHIRKTASYYWNKISRIMSPYIPTWQVSFIFSWLLILLFLIFIMPIIGLHHPLQQYLHYENLLPSFGGNNSFILGTDGLGRDRFSRLIYGMQYSLLISFGAMFGAIIIGCFLGIIAGLYRGMIAKFLNLFYHAIAIIPALFIIMLWAAKTHSYLIIISIIILIEWRRFFQIMYHYIIIQTDKPYITYARLFHPARKWVIFKREIFPNCKAILFKSCFVSLNVALTLEVMAGFFSPARTNDTVRWGHLFLEHVMINQEVSWLILSPFILLLLTLLAFWQLGNLYAKKLKHG